MNVKAITEYNNLHTSFYLFLLLVSVFSYMYFLSLSVVHVVLRQEAVEEVNKLRSEITYLESEYIEARLKISDKLASLDDFNQNQEKIFIQRGKDSLVFNTAKPE